MSNRLTFSLASLILIFGLVALPAMAHIPGSDERDHGGENHPPLLEDLPGLDGNGDGDTNDLGEVKVAAHGVHPTVASIALKPDSPGAVRDNMVVIVADDSNTADVKENGLVLVVTFDMPVNATKNLVDVDASNVLSIQDGFTFRVRNANEVTVGTPIDIDRTVIRVAKSEGMAFEVPITFKDTAIPNGTAKDALEFLTFYVQVNAGAALGLAMPAGGLADTPGAASYKSDFKAFKLVKMLPDLPTPPDTTKPMTTVTKPKMPEADGNLIFNVDFNETVSGFSLGDIMVENGTKEDIATKANGSYDITVMPTNANSRVTVTVPADVAMDAADNGNTEASATYTPDGYVSTVAISAADGTGDDAGKVIFMLDFNDKPNDFNVSNLNVTNVELLKIADLQKAEMATSGYAETRTLTVTPTATATAVTLTIRAGALTTGMGTDEIGIDSATKTHTLPTAPTAPAAPTNLTATPGIGMVTLAWTTASGATYEYKMGTGEWMDVATPGSLTISDLTGGTAVTFSVRVKAAGNVPAGIAADVTATPTSPGTAPLTIAAGGYLVIAGSDFDASTLPGVTPTEVAGFPDDLAEYLTAGGTINVTATGGDVIINEFMVARDANKIGSGDPADGQWIELYNKGSAEATNISVTFNQSKPAASPGGYADRFSNVAGQGWGFLGKFTDASVINGSANPDAPVNFVSIRRTDAGKDGSDQGAWGTAIPELLFAPGRVGTPGAKNTVDVFTPVPNDRPKLTNTVIINEVANRDDDTKEWIELKGPAGKSLKNWRLNIVTAVGKEETIYAFPNNDNVKISANGHLLLTDVDPLHSELEADFTNGVPDPQRYKNAVVTLGALPNDGNFLLVLRSKNDKNGTHEAIEDIAGYVGAAVERANPFTTLWPLRGNAGVISSHNKLVGGKVYARVRTNIHGYSATAGNKLHESAFAAAEFTGLGYDRNANASDPENGGTPGYPRGNFKHNGADAPGNVIISEIMFATGNGGPVRNRNLPQWIEIHNTSDVNSVRLADWRLEIVNSGMNADGSQYAGKFSENVGLSGTIPPNQTYLIVSHLASSYTRLPEERIKVVGKKFNEELMNRHGFHLTLRANVDDGNAANHVVVDTVGNLNDPAPGDRRSDARSFAGNAWELSALGHAIAEDNSRISISRRVNIAPARNPGAVPGTKRYGWILTDVDKRYSGLIQLTYYGRTDDRATPGYTIGGALPVQLSTFRPDRLDDGTIVIRWITESELDNAGFNILRSDARDGQFTKLNTQLIAGQGTTSERTAYEFIDKTAKPNVVYYYQIQDVSLDGDVATLRTARLRGHVSAAGKAATTWGELKALQ